MSQTIRSTGPVLLFGGPYSNLEAFEALLAEAHRRGIPDDHIISTGDLVAYGADARACVHLARRSGIHVVMGNCEEQLAEARDDCGCGFSPGSACEQLSRTWYAHALASLDSEDRRFLGSRPRRLDLHIGAVRLAVVHAAPSSINRFVFASTPARVKALEINETGVDGVIAGHSGLPFTQIIEGRLWHNPGAGGLPANDGTSRVWFSVLSATKTGLEIEHAALEYDHHTAARKMRDAGLPEGYAACLRSGLWPSCDVLPTAEMKATGKPLSPARLDFEPGRPSETAWPMTAALPHLSPGKFRDARITAGGETRAHVALKQLEVLWINTGTLCNLACTTCYIESSPRNERLAYISATEVATYLDEIETRALGTSQIGFTGGEPFMNPDIIAMLEDSLRRGFETLVLTNAMKPMEHHRSDLLRLLEIYGDRLLLRVSIDHYTQALHELERGPRSWSPAIEGLRWLSDNGFRLNVAGRLLSGEAEAIIRAGYRDLFETIGLGIDAGDPVSLMLFPEMDETVDVPEITEACWGILGKSPADVMCSSARMVVKRKGAASPSVLACTLLAYDPQFELGTTLADADRPVALNHPHCAKFCVLGGAACSR